MCQAVENPACLATANSDTVSRVILTPDGTTYVTMTQSTVTHSATGSQQTSSEAMPRGEKIVLLLLYFQVWPCICLIYR